MMIDAEFMEEVNDLRDIWLEGNRQWVAETLETTSSGLAAAYSAAMVLDMDESDAEEFVEIMRTYKLHDTIPGKIREMGSLELL